MLMVLLIQAGRHQSVQGSLHYLGSMVIAVPPLLLSAHLAELRVLNPTDTELPQLAAFLLLLGISLLLGAVPFQAWPYAVSIESSAIVSSFVFSVVHGLVVFKLFWLIHQFPWLVDDGNALALMSVVGLASIIMGSVFAAFQRDFGKLLAWTILFDTGFLLVGVSLISAGSLAILTLLVFNRAVAASLLAMGMDILRTERGDNKFLSMKNMMWQNPVAVLAVAVGGLSLAGFPLTGGFTARWLVIQELPAEAQRWALVLLVTGGAVSFGYLRGIALTAGRSESGKVSQKLGLANFTILLLLLAQLVLALYPQVLLNPITRVMTTWGLPR
jgi:NADH-quinone oxidoreductase subunit N